MRDHKEADSIAEESIRNYKTVTALGAESSMETKYVSLVRAVDWLSTHSEKDSLLNSLMRAASTQRFLRLRFAW